MEVFDSSATIRNRMVTVFERSLQAYGMVVRARWGGPFDASHYDSICVSYRCMGMHLWWKRIGSVRWRTESDVAHVYVVLEDRSYEDTLTGLLGLFDDLSEDWTVTMTV